MSKGNYEPELGQAFFGQPCKEYTVPEWLEAFLAFIRDEVRRVEWNIRQEELVQVFWQRNVNEQRDLI